MGMDEQELAAAIDEIFDGMSDPEAMYADDGLAADPAVLTAMAMAIESGSQTGTTMVHGILSPAYSELQGLASAADMSTSYSITELGVIDGNVINALWGQSFPPHIIAASLTTENESGHGERRTHLVTRAGRVCEVMHSTDGTRGEVGDRLGSDKSLILARCLGADLSYGLDAWTPAMAIGSWVSAPVLERLSEDDSDEDEATTKAVHHLLHTLTDIAAIMNDEERPSFEDSFELLSGGAASIRERLQQLARTFNAHGFTASARIGLLPESFGGEDGVRWAGEGTTGVLLARHASPVHPIGYQGAREKHEGATTMVLSMLAHTGLLYAQ